MNSHSATSQSSNFQPVQGKFRPVRLLNLNAQSIKNKKAEFCNLIESTVPDIIVCTETWLNSDVANGEIFPPDLSQQYNVFRRDREQSQGGGVFIAVSRDYICTREKDFETDCEILWIKISVSGCKSFYVCAFYHPHEGDEKSMKNFELSVNSACKINSHIWIAGDMNLPGYDWRLNCLKPNCHHPDITMKFLDVLNDNSLIQMVTEPTRKENILDLFITNNDSRILKLKIIPGISDHDGIVYVEADISPIIYKEKPRKIHMYKRADWEGLRDHMSKFCNTFITLNATTNDDASTNQLWDSFKTELNASINKYIPSKVVKRRNGLPYVNKEIKHLMKKRDKLHAKKDLRYREIKHLVQRKLREAYWKYVEDMITPTDATDNYQASKRFWSLFKHSRTDSTGIPSLKYRGQTVADPRDKANLLNNTFYSAFSSPTINSNLPKETCSPYPDMPEIHITTNGVASQLNNLKPYKAAGPDAIRPKVLKELSQSIAPILQIIFTKSLQSNQVPDDWKQALITPVFKKGDRDCPSNYRPISLTCICSKLMEHIVTSNMIKHLEQHNILYYLQHGFRHGRSCETQILELTTTLQANLNDRMQTDLIIMDFSKAFDKVCHTKLLTKLDYYGIRNNTLKWISCFLNNRKQCVVVNGTQSSYLPVLSGVPQGSVIGPSLFLIYINDLPEYVDSTVHLFADDTVMYLTVHNEDHCAQLQRDINQLEIWENHWSMNFNPDKCELLRITRKRTVIEQQYTLHGKVIKEVNTAKYLGVHISGDLKWNHHIGKITSKANRTLGFVKRNLRVKSCTLRERAYLSLVRPQLEYCSSIWDPRKGVENNGSHRIEMVQRRAARWVMSNFDPKASVTDMLDSLGWRSLEQRRVDSRLCLMYKLAYNLIPLSHKDQLRPPRRRSRHVHELSFLPLLCSTTSHRLSFFPRTISQWNSLPNHLFYHCNSVNLFRTRVSVLNHKPVNLI